MDSSKISVGLVVHDYDPNFGQGRYCVELVRRLHENVRFTIFANTFNAPQFGEETRVKIPAIRFNALTTVYSFIPTAQYIVGKHSVDLIHAQGLTLWHGDLITGHICNAAREKRMNTKWIKPRLFMRLVIPIERRFYRHQSNRRLIAISRTLEEEVRQYYGWNRPVSVIYHGTDSDVFRPADSTEERLSLRNRFGIPGDQWTWLFMGEATKGLRQCIDQLKQFPEARLLVVTRSRLESFIAQADLLGVRSRVVFRGFESQPELAFRAADVFLYPSDYDPFGMVVTEAMASGIPVVVGRDMGASELIDHGVNGLLFDPHRPDEITACLRLLKNSPGMAETVGRLGRATLRQHGWDSCAAATLQVYKEVDSEKRSGANPRTVG
jgi:UDP-glucose:(heptosyl)LPS alpha-1,3-glucosyltransferase